MRETRIYTRLYVVDVYVGRRSGVKIALGC